MTEYEVAPAQLSYSTIQKVAEKLSDVYFNDQQDKNSIAIDLDKVLQDIDGDIEYGDGRESSYIDEKGNFHIFLPNMTSVQRDRFTIAHELGHYFFHYLYPLHKKQKASKRFGRGSRNKAETQANVFASAFLMPREKFKKVYSDQNGDMQSVADAFDVSVAAAKVRAQVLGLEG